MLHFEMGQEIEALPLMERAVAIYEDELGLEHPVTASGLSDLAAINHVLEHYTHAQSLNQRSLASRGEALGATHPETAISLYNSAILHIDMSRGLLERLSTAQLSTSLPEIAVSQALDSIQLVSKPQLTNCGRGPAMWRQVGSKLRVFGHKEPLGKGAIGTVFAGQLFVLYPVSLLTCAGNFCDR